MNPLRWSGFLSFVVLTAIVSAAGMFLIEPFVKNSLEDYLSQKNNASVNIGEVAIDYFPLKMQVLNLQVADTQNLGNNAVQIEAINFQLSSRHLLLKKLIIDDMSIDNVQINTQRKVVAKRFKEELSEEKLTEIKDTEVVPISAIELPDIDAILDKENLISNNIIATLKQDLNDTDEIWREIKKDIVSSERWDEYNQRYAAIKKQFKGNTKDKLRGLKEANKLKQNLANEITKINQAKQQFNSDTQRLNDEFKQLKSAPADDIEKLKKKYKLDNLDAQNITQMLLGEQTAEYIALADKWYKKIKPYIESDETDEEIREIERSAGKNIKFTEFEPLPDLLIRRIAITANLPRGQFAGEVKNLSSNQSINAQPMSFVLSGVNMVGRESEDIRGEFNYVNPEKGFSWVDYTVNREILNNVSLSKNKNMMLDIQQSLMNIKIKTRLSNGVLISKSLFDFTQVKFDSGDVSQASSFNKMMAASFKKINKFNLDIRLKGSWGKLKVKLKSDLDDKVGAQLKAQVNKKSKEFEENLKTKLTAKLKEPLEQLEKKRQKLDKIKSDVADKEKQLKQRLSDLKSEIKQKKSAKKNKLNKKFQSKKDKLKQRLKDKFKT